MPMVRAMRMLNAIEAGTTTGAQLQVLLADGGRLAELNVLLGMRGQSRRMSLSSTAMTAVIASSTAMAAMIANSTAMTAVAASATAMNAVAANSTAMAAVIASSTTMNIVAASATARAIITANPIAFAAVEASNMATGKFVAVSAALNPALYDDMNAVAASSTAMNAVVASATALKAVAASATALKAVVNSTVAETAVRSSIQDYRSTIVSTLNASTSVFSKVSGVVIGNGAGTFDAGANLSNFYIPISCTDDGDTSYSVQYLVAPNTSVVSIGAHSGSVVVTTGLTTRGVRVVGSGGSSGSVIFDVYTAV